MIDKYDNELIIYDSYLENNGYNEIEDMYMDIPNTYLVDVYNEKCRSIVLMYSE